MEYRHAESTHEVAGGPAKIVQEVSERRIAHRIRIGEVDGSQVVSCARLGYGLAQKLRTIAKRVTAAQLSLGLLENEVIAVQELRVLGKQTR